MEPRPLYFLGGLPSTIVWLNAFRPLALNVGGRVGQNLVKLMLLNETYSLSGVTELRS